MGSSFYKLLVTPDFNSQLRLPPQFVKEHAEILPRKATLRIGAGESWIVKVERIGHHHFFTDGWEKFSKDVGLEFQQFLLFFFDGESGFNVSAYGMTGCEKELISVCGGSEKQGDSVSSHEDFAVESESGDEDHVKIVVEEGDFRAGKQGKKWRFSAELKKQHETELEVPTDFAKATGIAENGNIVILTHPKSKKWPVFVTSRKLQEESFAMTVGWNDFLVGAKVTIGSTILFEFLSNGEYTTLEAKVVKNGGHRLYSPKKRRGRPPKSCKFSQ
ncbi:B3 domain-containing protein REM9-like [Henckelia pumila]|uniref:B3 domain-containing protein REM9-like n=1 Tax=Henckelia pumila TaxID=405737 RepID=UPI003C6E5331